MSNLHLVTVATHKDGYFDYLVESCKKNGKELKVLGYGEKWKGFNWRFTLILDYLKSLNKDDIVCVIDGYDVLCTRNLKELSDEFIRLKKKHNCKIIIGEDKLLVDKYSIRQNFNNILVKYIIFGTCNTKSLNAGTYIGYVYDLLVILQNIYNLMPYNIADDQILFTKYCKLHNSDIHIDINNELFLTIDTPHEQSDKYVIVRDNKLLYNNNNPFFIHGPGETYLDNVIIKLGYNYNERICDKLLKKYYEKAYFRIVNNIYILISIGIIIIIILFTIFYYIFNKKIKLLFNSKKLIKIKK
jgi:hypothetical protein